MVGTILALLARTGQCFDLGFGQIVGGGQAGGHIGAGGDEPDFHAAILSAGVGFRYTLAAALGDRGTSEIGLDRPSCR
jgi:hypothetical protein